MQGTPALAAAVPVKGPDEDKIKQILARTGYTLDVTTGIYVFYLFIYFNMFIRSVTVCIASCPQLYTTYGPSSEM